MAGVIGVLIWQITIIIVFIILQFVTDYTESEMLEIAYKCATFIPYFIIDTFIKAIHHIRLHWYKRHLIICDLCEKIQSQYPPNENRKYPTVAKVSIFVVKKNMSDLVQDETNKYYVKYKCDCKDLNYIPHKNMIYDGRSENKNFDINLYKIKEGENSND